MAKKQDNQNSIPSKSKRGVIKRKQMFNELSTLQQQKAKKTRNDNVKEQEERVYGLPERIQQQEYHVEQEADLKNKNGHNVQQICQAVNRLFAKNKIGVKNAFEVPIIDLQTMDDYKTMQSQNSWKVLSSTLQNDYRIYGYRVDAIHSITYKILNILSRAATQQPSGKTQQQKLKREQGSSGNIFDQDFFGLRQNFLDHNIDPQKNQLQKNVSNLDIQMMEYSFSSDPILQRTKRLFDQPGLKGLLMNNITINKDLQLPLNSSKISEGISQIIQSLDNRQVKVVDHPLQIFESIQKVKYEISSITRQEHCYMTKAELDGLWKKAIKNKFQQCAQPYQYYMQDENNHFSMIDENLQNRPYYENESFKQISDFIKIKKPIKNKFHTNYEMEHENDAKWLNEVDRKFLGIKSHSSLQNRVTQIKPKLQRDEDFIDFNEEDEDKAKVLRKQAQKMQFKQQIEDKFLMPVKLMNQFKIQKILTLRQEQQIQAVYESYETAMNEQQIFMQKQIDIKRQNMSIRDTKQKVFQDIKNRQKEGFMSIFDKYNKTQSEISPALCFLTLLHLANQHNLAFENIQNQEDFLITKESIKTVVK